MKRLSGFSLMEMMVVLLIVSIVAAASAPMVNRKMVADAVGGCKWRDNDNTIFYNGDGRVRTVAIGTQNAGANNPRLHIATDNDHPHIRLTNGGSSINLDYDTSSVLLTNESPSESGNSVIIGEGANAKNSDTSVVIGGGATAENATSTPATGGRSVVVGYDASTKAKHTVAIGDRTTIKDGMHYSVAVGINDTRDEARVDTISGIASTALGYNAIVDADYSTAIGAGSRVLAGADNTVGSNSVAIGRGARTHANNSISIGISSNVTGIPNSGEATIGARSIAIGVGANTVGDCSISIGAGAGTTANNSIAIGRSSVAFSLDSIALGGGSANAINSLAFGGGSRIEAAASQSIAIGIGSYVNSTEGVAIGRGAHASGGHDSEGVHSLANNATAVGYSAKAYGNATLALGADAIASGDPLDSTNLVASIAIGTISRATGTSSLAIGTGTLASGESSIAIGQNGDELVNQTVTHSGWKYYEADTVTCIQEEWVPKTTPGVKPGFDTGSSDGEWVCKKYEPNWVYRTRQSNKPTESTQEQIEAFVLRASGNGGDSGMTTTTYWRVYKEVEPDSWTSQIQVPVETGKTQASGVSSIAFGHSASAGGDYSIAIGANTKADAKNSVAIGYGAKTSTENTIVLGDANATVYIPGNLVVGKTTVLGVAGSNYWTAINIKDYDQGLDVSGWRTRIAGQDGNKGLRESCKDGSALLGTDIESLVSTYSDRRLKNVGEAFKAGLEELKKLELFHYTYKKDESKTPHVGVMAQDLMKIFPDAVWKGEDGFYRIRMEDMFYALVNAVKELDAKIEALKSNEIAELRKENKEMHKLIEALQKQNEKIVEQNEKLEKRINALERKVK